MRLASNPAFTVTDRGLFIGRINANDVLTAHHPPVFIFVLDRVRQNCRLLGSTIVAMFPGSIPYYSVKTNAQPRILQAIASEGFGAQVVSPKELELASNAGFPADKILIDGIFHDDAFFSLVETHDNLLVIESWLSNISKLQDACIAGNHSARLGLRFRYPRKGSRLGFSAKDHEELDQLGIVISQADRLQPCMLACHPGSQIQDPSAHAVACRSLLDAWDVLEQGQGVLFQKPVMLNLGGGFPEPEMATPEHLNEVTTRVMEEIQQNHDPGEFTACFEPGRYIVADAGAFVATILQMFKDDDDQRWALIDVGMDVLSRFANSHYRFFLLEHPDAPHGTPISIQGRVPTEQDVFGKGVHFARDVNPGEHVLIMNCGAYGSTFSMRFSYEQPDCIFIDDNDIIVEKPALF
ncbi:MAG TPA: hypothetical protein VKM55_21345 [Candidatus Lokiarchaeia archaeon]|nr:hypothetical protein [Candidatus Lokiarchaeia archaeon]